ncbi:MAG: M15 family metallopeptidase [Spirochaetota bacterium]
MGKNLAFSFMKIFLSGFIISFVVFFLSISTSCDDISFILPDGHPFKGNNLSSGFEYKITLKFGESVEVISVSAEDGNKWYKCAKNGFTFFLPEAFIIENKNTTLFDENSPRVYVEIDLIFPIPLDYRPDDLVSVPLDWRAVGYEDRVLMLREEAMQMFGRLIEDARKDGVIIRILSAYRDALYQSYLYLQSIRRWGIFQNRVAKPGFSEHQLGIACDLTTDEIEYKLSKRFDHTRAYQWLMENIHRYNIALSYPKYKEKITGYMYEPWHFRYHGNGLWHDLKKTWEPFYSR